MSSTLQYMCRDTKARMRAMRYSKDHCMGSLAWTMPIRRVCWLTHAAIPWQRSHHSRPIAPGLMMSSC